MVSLLDIAPLVINVPIRGQSIGVLGISALGIASLLRRYPALQDSLAGREVEALTAEALLQMVPDAITAIIAAGCGHPNEPDVEQAAASLTVAEQLDVLTAIMEATFPRGLAPFLEKLGNLQSAAGFVGGSKVQPGS